MFVRVCECVYIQASVVMRKAQQGAVGSGVGVRVGSGVGVRQDDSVPVLGIGFMV